jgi:hypothetical protein
VRRRRIGGALVALCVAVGASGVLAIGLLAPPNEGIRPTRHLASPAPPRGRARATVPVARPPVPSAGLPTESFVSQTSGLPVAGEATVSGCSAALEYLNAYAAPGFAFECPGDAQGHEAMTTCVSEASPCSVLRLIVIADPCPNAYMNEASNSWALIGASDAPIDPYGFCA